MALSDRQPAAFFNPAKAVPGRESHVLREAAYRPRGRLVAINPICAGPSSDSGCMALSPRRQFFRLWGRCGLSLFHYLQHRTVGLQPDDVLDITHLDSGLPTGEVAADCDSGRSWNGLGRATAIAHDHREADSEENSGNGHDFQRIRQTISDRPLVTTITGAIFECRWRQQPLPIRFGQIQSART